MYKIVLAIFLFFCLTTHSSAYLGPGIGGGILVATLGIIIAFFAAIFGLLWFPIKRFLKKKKKKKEIKID